MKTATRVIIADDHELARSGLQTMIGSERSIEIVGLASNGREAVSLTRELRPDLVLMDLRMPDLDGLSATRQIKEIDPRIVVIVVTMYENPQYFFEAIQAGAASYLLKDASQTDILRAIRQAMHNETTLSPKLLPHLMRRIAIDGKGLGGGVGRLTEREREVLGLLAQGLSNREIAEKIVVTEGTVKVHVSNIFSKLDVSDRTQAVVRAISLGLILSGVA